VTARLILAGAGGLVIALVATPLAAVVARRLGIVDHPGELKPQQRAVPYLGGVAVFVAAVAGGAVGRPLLLLPLGLALAVGVTDDAVHIAPAIRLAGQLAIGVIVAAVVPTHLPGPVGPVLVTAVAVLLMNGVNMIDGLDALAGGVTAVAVASFAWMLRGDARELALGLALALAGFLVYNRPPARIYLGDGGAYLLGTALTVLLASAWSPGRSTPVGVAALVLVAVPVAEVLFAVIRRLRSRRSLVLGDRGHPYDRLVARGWPAPAASALYIAVTLVCAGVALAVAVPRSVGPATVAAVLVAVALVATAAGAGVLTPDRPEQS
jgi:UDP-GlcNAc:undecaprenyl-phosphate GlcNAc-1-phosphate transferase